MVKATEFWNGDDSSFSDDVGSHLSCVRSGFVTITISIAFTAIGESILPQAMVNFCQKEISIGLA
jgi:hypothetical protein